MFNELLDIFIGAGPEHHAVSRIHKARLDSRIMQSQENGIYAWAREILVEHLGLLLGIPSRSVRSVSSLHLYLQDSQREPICSLMGLTGSSSEAAINAS